MGAHTTRPPRDSSATVRVLPTFFPAVVIVVLGVVQFHAATLWRETDELVERAHESAVALDRVLGDLEDAQLALRAYLASRRDDDLARQRVAQRTLAMDAGGLRSRVLPSGANPARVDTFRLAIDSLTAEMDAAVGAARERGAAGASPAAYAISRRTGQIAHVAARVRGANQRRLRDRRAALRRYETAMIATVAFGTLIAAVAALATALRLGRLARRATASTAAVEEQNRRLDAQAAELTAAAAELRDANARLAESEAVYRAVVQATPLPVVTIDRSARVRTWNPASERTFGWKADEVLGGPLPFLSPETSRETEALLEFHRNGQPITGVEVRRRRKDGARVDLVLYTAPLRDGLGRMTGSVGLLNDVTERRRTEENLRNAEAQLVQSQKMEAVGRLAGGVAHDFNNLLTVIGGNVQLLIEDVPRDSPLRDELDETYRAVQRASALTRQLLTFSRRQVAQRRSVDLAVLVAELRKLLDRVIGEDVELRLEVEPGLWPVCADPGQIEQVLVNLAVNARDAMPKGGRLRIAAWNAPGDELPPGAPALPADREYVVVEVADTGAGMSEETVARAFEPFFTTKPEGEGTGLGLSTVYGIVAQSGGTVWLRSRPGTGTIAYVSLPRDVSAQAPDEPEAAPAREAGGGGTVLLLEDEPDVRATVTRILARAGIRVLAARSPEEALGLVAEHAGSVDLILSDVVMPRVSGPALTEQIRAGFPDIPVLFMSGYTGVELARHGVGEAGEPLLEKPFSPGELVRRVRAILDRAG